MEGAAASTFFVLICGPLDSFFFCRGPLFWAYEFGNMKLAAELVARGADLHAKDGQGNTPEDLKGPVVDYDAYFDGEEEEDEDYEEEEEEEEEDYEEDEQEQTADDPKAEL